MARIGSFIATHRLAAAGVGVLVLALAGAGVALALRGGGDTREGAASVAVTPAGAEMPRLGPITIAFNQPPREDDPADLVSLTPAAGGSFAWLDEQTLLFQPDFPGLERGAAYTLTVDGENAGLDTDFVHNFVVEGRLEVANVIPADGDVEVPRNAPILVQFNRSVAPLTTLDARGDAPVVVFDPPLRGEGEWLNTSLYRFTPLALEPSTTYRATIEAGLTSAADGVLDQAFTWQFETVTPALASSTPPNNTQFVGTRRPIDLTFNQPMDRASVEAGVQLLDEAGQPVAVDVLWGEGDTLVTLSPVEVLALSSDYEVVVPAGLAGQTGGETSEERRIAFRTVDPPALARSEPQDGATDAGRFGVQLGFNVPMNTDSVEERLTIAGVDLEGVFFDWFGDDNELFIPAQLQPATEYTVSIAAGATDRDGTPLPASSFSFTTGALPSQVTFAVPSQVATYSAAVEPVLYFHATNLDAAEFALYELTSDEAGEILRTNQIPNRGEAQWLPSGQPLREWEAAIEGDANTVTLGSTSLSGGGPLPAGDYYVVSSNGDFRSQLMFSVVDVALVTKLSVDELLVWALDYQTGEPLTNAAISVTGAGLGSVVTARTDSDGLASVTVPSPRDVTSEERAYLVSLDADGRRGVASTRWQTGSEPWLLNVPVEYYPREFVGHLYTDRPIYRPNELVQYKGVVRLDDDARYSVPPPDAGLELVIRDAQFNEFSRTPVSLNDFGTFAGEIQLPPSAPTGFYSMELQSPLGQGMGYEFVTFASFTVAEFRVPEFEVELTTDRTDYVDGESIEAEATGTFFFGGPLANAGVEWTALASPTFINFAEYQRYSFVDSDIFSVATINEPLRASGSATTDAAGVATFEVPAVLRGGEGPQDFTLTATVQDQNQQAVSASASVTVHPASIYAGVAPEEYVAVAGQEATVALVTVDTEGAPVANRAVTVSVYERTWITTKEETSDGARRYRSEPQDTLVDTIAVTTNAQGEATASFTPEGAGTLRIVAEVADDDGRSNTSSAFLWVSGAGAPSWQIRNDDIIELVPDRELYDVGDTAEVLVPAPFEGARGLVTLERGRILSRSTQLFPTGSERLNVTIEDGHVPNVFVGVVLYRPPTEADPLPRYKVGYADLQVSTASRTLTVTVEPDRPEARPGETIRYDIHVEDAEGQGVAAEVSLAVVDRAVLSLAQETGPDGLAAFWYQRGLGVVTASSLAVSIDRTNDVISEPSEGGKGGGADEALRSDFRNTAHWEAQIRTDADGNASVEFTLPDNLTTWRAQARAVSGDTLVGEATSELLVTQPLLLRPALPRFLRVGDSASMRLLVTNSTDEAAEIGVELEASGIEVGGETAQQQAIDAGQTAIFEWPAEATQDGQATLTFRTTGEGELSDAVEVGFPVYLDVTPETTATGGVVTDAARSEAVFLPSFALQQGGGLEVTVEGSLVGLLASEVEGLRPIPGESVERVASRVLATLAVRRLQGVAPADLVDARTAADVSDLLSAQRLDGGWGWCRNCDTNMQVTGWVLLALADAQEAGRAVSPDVIWRATPLVLDYVNRPSDVENPADRNEHAFLLYALVRAQRGAQVGDAGGGAIFGDNGASILRSIAEQDRAALTNRGRAYTTLGLLASGAAPEDETVIALLNDLAAAAISSANGNHWEDERAPGSMHTETRLTAAVLEALAAADPDQPLIEETVRWLQVARDADRWETAPERSAAIRALAAYASGTGEAAGDFEYEVRLDTGDDPRTLLEGRFTPGGDLVATSETPLSELPLGAASIVSFARDFGAPGRMYYRMHLRYLTPAVEVEALNRGLALSHEYSLLDAPETRVSEAPLGEILRVKLTVVAPSDLRFVEVSDLLPGGLEPIDPQLDIVGPDLRAQLEEDRRQAMEQDAAPDYFAPWFGWYFSPWEHVDVRDDRVSLYATQLPKGVYEYVYYARATTPGDFFVAPAQGFETYFPDVFGRSDSGRFIVRP